MCRESLIKPVLEIAKSLYDKRFDHGLPHVERVRAWARRIIGEEKLPIPSTLLEIAVFLHDVGRYIGEPHAYYSALVAEELLMEAECASRFIEEVSSAILSHSYSFSKSHQAKTDLAKVISDADKLDALGVVGFLRVFIFGERNERTLEQSLMHFHEKILKLPELMYFDYSRKISVLLAERTRLLLTMLLEELNPEKLLASSGYNK
ncbi:MAG: HD domain-containing protein [Desulfurococcaceae archaeon]